MLKVIWKDPVWSNVIAAGILAVVAALGSYFLNWWPIIWSKVLFVMNTIWKLVTYPVNIPIGTLVILIAIMIWLLSRKKVVSNNIITTAIPRQATKLLPTVTKVTTPLAPEKPQFSANEESVIKILAAADGQWLELGEIATNLRLSRLVTEQAVERLFHLNFLIDSLNYLTGRSFRLSPKGRDYTIEHNYVN